MKDEIDLSQSTIQSPEGGKPNAGFPDFLPTPSLPLPFQSSEHHAFQRA
jgi:hypothetical protein